MVCYSHDVLRSLKRQLIICIFTEMEEEAIACRNSVEDLGSDNSSAESSNTQVYAFFALIL